MKTGLLTGLTTLVLVTGCAVVPETITHKVPADKVTQPKQAMAKNGAIFQGGGYSPIFENRRARMVGDNLIVSINENTRAAKQGNGSASGNGNVTISPPMLFNKTFNRLSASTSSEAEFENKNAATSSNNFSGSISVTVIDVQENGNLLVSGEKQIAMDTGAEFIRFSGVVNPKDIAPGNIVSSTMVADARVEYRTNTRMDVADLMSKLARFFLSVVPF